MRPALTRLAALLVTLASLVTAPVGAQVSGRVSPRAAGLARPRLHRLALAARQGSGDEVMLPVTEIRVGRAAARSEDRGRPVRLCLRPAVELRRVRGRDAPRWVGSLTDCAGRPTLRAMAALALLAQPQRDFALNLPAAMGELRRMAPAAGLALADDVAPARPRRRRDGATAPAGPVLRDPHTRDPIVEVAPGARALHPRLLQLLQSVVERFPGHAVEIVSGYRPGASASRHAHARALDLRLVGVRREDLRDFARGLPGAGVGFYPNSVFIHLDVRDAAEGNAFWTDYSGPGETPRYGQWPPTDRDVQSEVGWMARQADAAAPADDAALPAAPPAPATDEPIPDGLEDLAGPP